MLAGPGQITAEAIGSWAAITSTTHWNLFNRSRVDGADFYMGDAEPTHIHRNGEVHLAATNGLSGTSAPHLKRQFTQIHVAAREDNADFLPGKLVPMF